MPPSSYRLSFREWKADEAETLLSIFGDPRTMAFWPKPFDLQACQAWIARSQEQIAQYGLGRWKIVYSMTGEVVGDAGIFRTIVNGKEEFDLGYIIHAPFWHNGFGLEAAKACLDYAFHQCKVERVVANMAHDHHHSRKVAERLGMHFEGMFINTRNRDIETCLFVATKPKALENSLGSLNMHPPLALRFDGRYPCAIWTESDQIYLSFAGRDCIVLEHFCESLRKPKGLLVFVDPVEFKANLKARKYIIINSISFTPIDLEDGTPGWFIKGYDKEEGYFSHDFLIRLAEFDDLLAKGWPDPLPPYVEVIDMDMVERECMQAAGICDADGKLIDRWRLSWARGNILRVGATVFSIAKYEGYLRRNFGFLRPSNQEAIELCVDLGTCPGSNVQHYERIYTHVLLRAGWATPPNISLHPMFDEFRDEYRLDSMKEHWSKVSRLPFPTDWDYFDTAWNRCFPYVPRQTAICLLWLFRNMPKHLPGCIQRISRAELLAMEYPNHPFESQFEPLLRADFLLRILRQAAATHEQLPHSFLRLLKKAQAALAEAGVWGENIPLEDLAPLETLYNHPAYEYLIDRREAIRQFMLNYAQFDPGLLEYFSGFTGKVLQMEWESGGFAHLPQFPLRAERVGVWRFVGEEAFPVLQVLHDKGPNGRHETRLSPEQFANWQEKGDEFLDGMAGDHPDPGPYGMMEYDSVSLSELLEYLGE